MAETSYRGSESQVPVPIDQTVTQGYSPVFYFCAFTSSSLVTFWQVHCWTRLSVGMSWDFRAVPKFWKSSRQPAMIKRICNRQGNNTKLFFQNWGPALNSGKNLKVTNYFRPKTLWIWPKFFPYLPHLYKIYILQKYWSETTNLTLSSGLKKTLPRIWGHHRQLDDQDKEPMIDTKIM